MKFTLEINMDNAAFEANDGTDELRRILGEVRRQMVYPGHEIGRQYPTRDVNGNFVGFWEVKP